MKRAEFREFCALVTSVCGIKLGDGKEELVKARLGKRIRSLGMTGFAEYLDHLRDNGRVELPKLLDAISTNVTSFFRESDHFEYLRNSLLPRIVQREKQRGRRLRIWSAGCSSGEEPYSIAIHLREGLPDLERWDVKILATDLSMEALQRGTVGSYEAGKLAEMPPQILRRYFRPEGARGASSYRVCDQIRSLVHFAPLNLMQRWPMRGPFDAIFCRNVMIYFDKPTQGRLVGRFSELLPPGGALIMGHSESLAGVATELRCVQPTIHEKP